MSLLLQILGVVVLLGFALVPIDPQWKTVGVLAGLVMIIIGRLLWEMPKDEEK